MDNKPYQSIVGGQIVWHHTTPGSNGTFHTYDQLKIQGNHHHYYNTSPHKVHVFLPPDYNTAHERYPVVYINDGDTAFWPGGYANKSLKAASIVSELVEQKKIRKLILVAVCAIDREFEYTHTHWTPGKPHGGIDQYAFYLTILKEFIDRNYRTIPSATESCLVGAGHGGLAAFLTANLFPEHFGNVIAMSPSFWLELDILGLNRKDIKETLLIQRCKSSLLAKKHPRLWIDWGLKRDGGNHNAIIEHCATEGSKEMVKVLTSQYHYTEGKDLFTFEDPIGGHDEDAWTFRLKLAFSKFYPPSETVVTRAKEIAISN